MTSIKRFLKCLVCTVVVLAGFQPAMAGAAINTVSVALDNPLPAATGVNYTWTWDGYQTGASSTQCVLVKFSVNADGTGGIPSNMGLAAATLTGTWGAGTTWTVDDTLAASGVLAFNGAAAATPAAGPSTIVIGGVTNPDTAAGGTYFETVTTYDTPGAGNTGGCLGSVLDGATVAAWETSHGQATSVTIDPSLSLVIGTVPTATTCGDTTTTVATSLNTIDLGHITAISQHAIAAQQLTVTTNAAHGYTVYVSYSGPLTGQSTSHTYADHAGTNGTPTAWAANGTEAFGYYTDSTSLSGTAARFDNAGTANWAALGTTGDELMHNASTPGPTGDQNCVAFQASEAGNTPADLYRTVVRYNAVGVF